MTRKLHEQPSAGKTHRGEGVLIRDGDIVFLTDMDTAGYLLAKHVPIATAVKVGRYEFEFRFYDPERRAEALALEFVNSCCHGFADAICRLKKVTFNFTGRNYRAKRARERGRNGHRNEERIDFKLDMDTRVDKE